MKSSFRKKFVFFCLMICLFIVNSLSLFAASAYFRLFDSSLYVELDSKNYVSHGNNPEWKSGSANNPASGDNYFYNNQMIFSSVVENLTYGKGLIFKVEILSGSWEYVLYESGIKYSRPFGLDLIIRGTNSISGTHTTIEFFRLGLQTNSTNTSLMTTKLVPYNIARQYSSIWLDALLVFDPFMDDMGQTAFGGTTYEVKSSENPYTATIRVSMYETDSSGNPSGNPIEVFDFEEVGFYKKPTPVPVDISAVLAVNPSTNAVSLDIEALGNDTSLSQVIADYSFTTQTYVSASNTLKNGKFHFYLSSSSDGITSLGGDNDRFVLRYTKNGRVTAVDNKFNSIEYIAQIVSSSTSSGASGTKSFNGSTHYGDTSDYHNIATETTSTSIYGDMVRWYDSGQIKVRICSAGERSTSRPWGVDDLVAGRYTSTVYIHVVSDF